MPRFKLTIEYDGSRYSGWQMQKGGKSIQGEIYDACRELFGTEKIDLFGAGRTDSGVHAIGQVAHIEAQTDLSLIRIKYGINDRLPPDICILNVEEAHPEFHARHDAIARSYIYQISRRRTAMGKKYVWWIKDQLDVEKMNETARHFIGLKNYKSFTDEKQEQGSTKVEIKHAALIAQKILKAFRRPFMLGGSKTRITPSIGIVIYPDDGSDINELIKKSDKTMYRAKEDGRNNYKFHE